MFTNWSKHVWLHILSVCLAGKGCCVTRRMLLCLIPSSVSRWDSLTIKLIRACCYVGLLLGVTDTSDPCQPISDPCLRLAHIRLRLTLLSFRSDFARVHWPPPNYNFPQNRKVDVLSEQVSPGARFNWVPGGGFKWRMRCYSLGHHIKIRRIENQDR